MTLATLEVGQSAKVSVVLGDDAIKARIDGLGLRVGQIVTVIRRACMGGPLQVRTGYTDVLMRPDQATLIQLS